MVSIFKQIVDGIQNVAEFRIDHLVLHYTRWFTTAGYWLVPLLFGVYAFAFRADGISEHYQMFGDQMRDWRIVSGSFSELPLVGTPRVGGGYSLGPIFYWVLWTIRTLFGPLPHCGGVGIALVYGLSAGVLLQQSLRSLPVVVAFAFCLFTVSSPFESSFSGNTAWNPGLSVSFVNLAFASTLAYMRKQTLIRGLITTVFAWFALQSHFPSIFFVTSILGGLVLLCWIRRGWRDSTKLLLGMVGIASLLQLPMTVHYLTYVQDASEDTVVSDGLWLLLSAPSRLRLYESIIFLKTGVIFILFNNTAELVRTSSLVFIPFVLSFLLLARTWPYFFLTVGPLGLAFIGYALLPGHLDFYWLVTLLAPFSATVVFSFCALPGRSVRSVLALLLFLLILLDQPVRYRRAPVDRMPGYGALLRGTLAVQASGRAYKRIEAEFVDPRSDPDFIAESLGMNVSATAEQSVEILSDGTIRWY